MKIVENGQITMSRKLTFTHNKLSQVLNFLYIRCVEISYSLSIFYYKQSTQGNTCGLVIHKFHYDLRPSGTLTECRLHLSTHTYILYE